jgi:hypothetical protein
VFLNVAQTDDTEDTDAQVSKSGDDIAPAQTREVVAAPGRCPFASGAVSFATP